MSKYNLHNAMRRAAKEKLRLLRVSKEPQWLLKDFYDQTRHKKRESKERSLTVELEKVREESVGHLQVVQDLQNQLMDARTQLKREIKEKETLQVEFEGITKKNNTLTRKLETETVEVARLQSLDKVNQADIEDLRDVYDLKHRAAQQDQHELLLISDKDEEIQKQTYAGEEMSQTLHDLLKKEVSLSEQNRSATNELARLQSLTAKQNEETRNLKTAVQDLQYQVELANDQICQMDEHKAIQTRKIAYYQEQLEECYILTTDLKQSVCDLKHQQEEEILAGVDLQHQVREGQELIRDKDEEIQNLTCAGEELSQALHDLQKKEVSLSEQNRNATNEVSQLESLNENLRKQVQELQKNGKITADENQRLIAKVARIVSLRQAETEQLQRSEELIRDKDEEIQNLTCAGKEMSQVLRDLQTKEVSLSDQYRRDTNELARLESLTAKQNEETGNLKTAVQDLQSQVELANDQICQMDEHKAIQTRKIAYYQEQLEECYILTTNLKQSVRDLKHQQEARLEEILAGVRQQRDVVSDISETTSGYQSDESLPESPASVSRTRSFLCRSAKCLLKVGLPLAITAVGVGLRCNYLMDYTYCQLLPYANNFEMPFM